MKPLRTTWLWLIVVLSFTASLVAQTQITTGVIQGVTIDQSGAVMPGTTVEARNLDTNFTKTQTTDANGRFAFLLLPPGRYTVTASHPGFSTLVQENADLTVGQAITLNITMKVSSAAERIVVTSTHTLETSETEAASTLDAVKEFQVVASGANAEFGRTAGGVVNVVTKSGTNEVHGTLFHFQRMEALTSNTSDDKPLTDFSREQFGGTIGGPIVKDKMF